MVGARYSLNFDDITDSVVMQYPEFIAAPPVVNRDGTLVQDTSPERDKATDDPEYGSLFNVVFKVQARPNTSADFSRSGAGHGMPAHVPWFRIGESLRLSAQQACR